MIYLSLGSNQGNRLAYLKEALLLLKEKILFSVQESIVFETKALLPSQAKAHWDQPYLNMVIRGKTQLLPEQFLYELQKIEQMLGRPFVYEKWAPRVIDIDILLWDNVVIQTPMLQIPHPELFNRPFLLQLLALLDPKGRYPSKKHLFWSEKTFAEIAHVLVDEQTCFSQSLVLSPELVGIVNITPDSFSDGGLFLHPQQAINQVFQLQAQGASIIELGAQSTRPHAEILTPAQEYQRLKPVLAGIFQDQEKKLVLPISIDTFSSEVIEQILLDFSSLFPFGFSSPFSSGFSKLSFSYPAFCPPFWVNDVTGHLPTKTLSHLAENNCKMVVMHSTSIPPGKNQAMDWDISPIDTIVKWAETKVKQLVSCGFTLNQIVLDPGIGFGKSAYQNIEILRNIKAIKQFGCAVMLGHSRKRFIQSFSKIKAAERDIETLAFSIELAKQGGNYLRVHHVLEHQRFFVAHHLSKSIEQQVNQ